MALLKRLLLPGLAMLIGVVVYTAHDGTPPWRYGLPAGGLFGWGFVTSISRAWFRVEREAKS